MMFPEPKEKRACIFFDGQNLYYSIKEAFGYKYPNYDISLLADWLCREKGWQLKSAHFYTGVPDAADNEYWNHFWISKMSNMGRKGIKMYSRPLRYRNQTVVLPDGTTTTTLVGQEKGVDVRIALDMVRAVRMKECDVVAVFSQDQDLSEVADEVRKIAIEQKRWVKIASVIPASPTIKNKRGINSTDWVYIDKKNYDSCIDPNDYRPKKTQR